MKLTPRYPIETPRLRLRPPTDDDAAALLTYRGDPGVCRYLPFEPMDEAVLARRLRTDLGRREITAEGEALTLAAELSGDGRVVGDVVLFFHSAQHRSGEIGYVFHPDVAGLGYATEACAAILSCAFDDLGLHRVTARMVAGNTASARLCDRLRMRQEAQFRSSEMFKGAWTDVIIYALLADEWTGSPAKLTSSSSSGPPSDA